MITIDKELCIGCGTCTAVCPANFAMNDSEGKAEPISQDVSDCAKGAEESCPVQAIKVE
jgi:ferredoxin